MRGFRGWLRPIGWAVVGAVLAMAPAAVPASAASTPLLCILGANPECLGLTIVGAGQGDSIFTSGTVGGQSADIFQKNTVSPTNPVTYIYFQVDRSTGFLSSNPSTMYLTVQYYDEPTTGKCSSTTPCFLTFNYDSTITSAPVNGAYGGTSELYLGGTPTWKSITWKLTQASFKEAENYGADFRIAGTVGVAVHEVQLALQPPSGVTPVSASSTISAAASSSSASSSSSSSSSASSAPSKTASSTVPKTGDGSAVPAAGAALVVLGLAGAAAMARRYALHHGGR